MSDCGHHRRSQQCALCLIFSLVMNLHPAVCTSSLSPRAQDVKLSRASTADHHGHTVTERPGGYRLLPGARRLTTPTLKQLNGTRVFLRQIFDKYGSDGVMTFESFQALLGSLGVGSGTLTTMRAQDVTRHAHRPHDHRTADYDDYEYHSEQHEQHAGDHPPHGPVDRVPGPALGDQGAAGAGLHTDHRTDIPLLHPPPPSASTATVVMQPGGGRGVTAARRQVSEQLDKQPVDGSNHRQHESRQRRASHRKQYDVNDVLTSHRVRRDANNLRQESDAQTPVPTLPVGTGKDDQCLSGSSLLKLHNIEAPITENHFLALCPALIQQVDSGACMSQRLLPLGHVYPPEDGEHEHAPHNHSAQNHSRANVFHVSQVPLHVWGYALLVVVIISLVGLLSVAIVPIINKVFYNHLLQFLVGLAVGTLTGDAFLHLLPHAMTHQDESGHHDHGDNGQHLLNVWRGLTALCGIYFFFIFERGIGIFHTWRRQQKKNKSDMSTSPKLYHTVEEHESELGAKRTKHDGAPTCEEMVMVVHPGKDMRHLAEDMHEELHRECEPEERDQLNHSHGEHGHNHGPPPSSIASVAWMVVMGDGLHNCFDGLAIGAAFASGLSGGISTSVAVFCHELPHEIGDFAVLLRAGMSVKKAIVYNCVSSILCLFGMIIGVCTGNITSATQWIFAATAGMFIYIALVDMLPELTAMTPRRGENPLVHLALQNAGMFVGAGIMALIAIYEDQLTLL